MKEDQAYHQSGTSNEGNINQFEGEEPNFENQSEPPDQAQEENESGLGPEQVANLLTSMTCSMVPEELRQQYIADHYSLAYQLMDSIGVEDLTKGANLKKASPLTRWIVGILGTVGLTVWKVKQYQLPESEEEKEEKEDQKKQKKVINEEEWQD